MLEETLRFAKDYEPLIYLALGMAGLYFAFGFRAAWQELQLAAFGLEREQAQQRVNRSATLLVLLIILGLVEFSLVAFFIPVVPQASPLPTPTLDFLATPTATLSPDAAAPSPIVPEATPTVQSACLPGQVEWLQPANGDSLSGSVDLIGTADIPNFGFYKFEVTPLGTENWTILQAGNTRRRAESLGFWDTSTLAPGSYLLRLVVTDNQGQPLPACVVQVNIQLP